MPWTRDFGPGLGLSAVATCPDDRRRVALFGPTSGHVVALTLAGGPRAVDVGALSFRVGGGDGASRGAGLGVAWVASGPGGPGPLAVTTPRDVSLFDVDRGAPAPPVALGRGVPSLGGVIASTRRVGGKGGGLVELLYCWHQAG